MGRPQALQPHRFRASSSAAFTELSQPFAKNSAAESTPSMGFAPPSYAADSQPSGPFDMLADPSTGRAAEHS